MKDLSQILSTVESAITQLTEIKSDLQKVIGRSEDSDWNTDLLSTPRENIPRLENFSLDLLFKIKDGRIVKGAIDYHNNPLFLEYWDVSAERYYKILLTEVYGWKLID